MTRNHVRALTAEEAEILHNLRRMAPAQRTAMIEFIRDLANGLWRDIPEWKEQAYVWIVSRVKQLEAQAVAS